MAVAVSGGGGGGSSGSVVTISSSPEVCGVIPRWEPPIFQRCRQVWRSGLTWPQSWAFILASVTEGQGWVCVWLGPAPGFLGWVGE